MFASFKALKCQSGAEKNKRGDEGIEEGAVPTPRSPRPVKPKLARRISRWKMSSPASVEDISQGDAIAVPYEEMEKPCAVQTSVTTINIEREDGTLGITLRGGMIHNNQLSKPVVITQLKPGGPAAREGTIKPGDRLLAVNGISLLGSTLAEAQALLQQPTQITALTIEYDVKLINSALRTNGPLIVEVERLKEEDLGLTLYQSEYGVFIEQVKRGSVADRCGALCEGDEILAVNNRRIDIKPVMVEQVVKLLGEWTTILQLEIQPFSPLTTASSMTWRGRSKTAEYVSPLACTWYGSGAVTHSEKLHTTIVREQSGFGLHFSDLPDGTIIIAAVQSNSPAERSGCLYPGDRVLAVNHRSVALDVLTTKDANDLLDSSPGGRLTIHVEFDVLDTVVPASGVFNVRLVKRGVSGLGLTIAASKDHEFVVCEVKKGSPAHRAGSLLPGDRLLSVNGTPLEQCTAEHIADILHQGDELISLRVERSDLSPDFRCHRKVTCTVELQRYGGPIGITIAGSEEPCQPITVSGLTPGGLAEQTGALLVGDEILAINDHSLQGKPLSTAHALLQTSPDLVCLKISRFITPNGRCTANMSPLQPSSVDSAVESWGSSHLDLTPSPDHCRVTADTGTIQKHPADWPSSNVQRTDKKTFHHSQLLDEITNENLNIQRELEMLSQEINEQSLNPHKQWKGKRTSIEANTAESSEASNTDTIQGRADLNGYVHMQSLPHSVSTSANNLKSDDLKKQEGDSCALKEIEYFEMSNFPEARQWQYVNSSQPSIRSEFQSYNMLTVELKKDPVYEDFGFSVSDGLYERGVFINRIRKGGPADLSQCLYPYDRILQVNNTCTQDFDCCLTVPLIATAGEMLTLLVARALPQETRAQYDQTQLDQNRGQPHYGPFLTCSNAMKRIVV